MLYFDCFSGMTGGMALGALVHAGADLALISSAISDMPIGGFVLEHRSKFQAGLNNLFVFRKSDRMAEPPEAPAHGGVLCLCGLNEELHNTFHIVQLDKAIPMFTNARAASAAIRRGAIQPPAETLFHRAEA